MLQLHVHGGYPSYEASGAKWRGIDHDAHMFVQTLKGNAINGYVTMKDADGQWRRFTTEKPEPAFDIFGMWAAGVLATLNIPASFLVPVPTSTAVALGQDEKGRKMAQAIAARAPQHQPLDALHWGEVVPKASQGGTRDADTLFRNLRALNNRPSCNIVLVDDVVTGGGHLIACARILRHFGHVVHYAVAAAQTVWEHPTGSMFDIAPRDLEADPLADF
jgi:hypothetical protein